MLRSYKKHLFLFRGSPHGSPSLEQNGITMTNLSHFETNGDHP